MKKFKSQEQKEIYLKSKLIPNDIAFSKETLEMISLTEEEKREVM